MAATMAEPKKKGPGRPPKKRRTGWAKLITDLRKAKRTPQPRVAELLGVPLATYQNWEQGRAVPSPIIRAAVERVLNDL